TVHRACSTTRAAVLPRSNRLIELQPWEPISSRSTSGSFATDTISSKGCPTRKQALALIPLLNTSFSIALKTATLLDSFHLRQNALQFGALSFRLQVQQLISATCRDLAILKSPDNFGERPSVNSAEPFLCTGARHERRSLEN